MILGQLLCGIACKSSSGPFDIEVSGITNDSRQVVKGDLFTAIKGEETDGHQYIVEAFERGASAFIVEDPIEGITPRVKTRATIIQVEDAEAALAITASNFFDNPSEKLSLVGITGTNGKTTIAYLIESIWRAESRMTGLIGTIETRYDDRGLPAVLTTPDSPLLMLTLSEMAENGVECVVMEVSSHALDRRRVDGCSFDAAVFTNLTQDHLDYHKTMESYFLAKKRLFAELLPASKKKNKYAIINIDDGYGEELSRSLSGELITYSLKNPKATVFCLDYGVKKDGIAAKVRTPWGEVGIISPLFGEHNLYNVLAAVGTAGALGSKPEALQNGINNVKNIPGRLERVINASDIDIFVDYAHTPDALANVLKTAREYTTGRLITVFGCGGDRDRAKRPIMGKVAYELSDLAIITSDNPRTEDPEAILDEIETGFEKLTNSGREAYIKILDRSEAIQQAVESANAGDTVVIAGKGHEDYQIVGTQKQPFDDRIEAKKAVEKLTG